jgi:signal transduction histidine kinase
MHEEVPEEPRAAAPARSTAALVASAAGSTLLFWWVGRTVVWSVDLQVAFLLTSFGLILAIAVGYSWTIDRVWRRTNEEANSALAAFKGDFVAGVSHELRTALTGIVGFAQLVDARLLGDDNAEAINAVVSQSVELSRVVDDLVARARLDSGGLTVEARPVPVVDQVVSAVGFVELMGAEVTVACEEAEVVVDPEALRHLLHNLLVNAHRHGLPPISVRGRSFGDQYICQVVDGGPGVPHEGEKDMFSPARKRGDDPRPGAVGLGLAVAHDLAVRMGCQLSYRHIRGEAHFILTVPLASQEEKPASASSQVDSPELRRAHLRQLEGVQGAK